MGIGAITLPERAPFSRKFSEQDSAVALDLLNEGQITSDGQEYDKEDKARGSGESLKRGVQGAAAKRGVTAPDMSVKVREQAPGAFVFGLAVKPPQEADDDDGGTPDDDLGALTRVALEERATDEGIDNPGDREKYPNKQALADAIRNA